MTGLARKALAQEPGPNNHLLVAGAGRAGTSFLVHYLSLAGLDTHLAQRGECAWYDPAAQAGFEDILLTKVSGPLPYVIKSPWTYEFIDEVLADPQIRLDGVIIPVRDLMESAASRVIVEQRAMHEQNPWMARLDQSWTHYGQTPGGVVYSLHPLDQARVLALGFHRLLERLVQADVSVQLLAFPRMVLDPDYLYAKLRPWLPEGLDEAGARELHRSVADDRKVRVGKELARAAKEPAAGDALPPSLPDLDRAALGRELERVRGLLAACEQERRTATAERDEARADLGRTHAAAQAQVDRLQGRIGALESRLEDLGRLADERLAMAEALRASSCWRLTAPLRGLRRLMGPHAPGRTLP